MISASGVDETVVVAMKFSGNRMAVCAFSISARFPNDAVISGTEGSLKVGWWCRRLVWVSRLLSNLLSKALGLVLVRIWIFGFKQFEMQPTLQQDKN